MTAETELKEKKWNLNKKNRRKGKRARKAVQADRRISSRGSYHRMELGNRKSHCSVAKEGPLKGSKASHHD